MRHVHVVLQSLFVLAETRFLSSAARFVLSRFLGGPLTSLSESSLEEVSVLFLSEFQSDSSSELSG